jgi:hypothetical protein
VGKPDPDRGERPERVQITVAELLGRRPCGAGAGRARHAAPGVARLPPRRGFALAAGSMVAAGSVVATTVFGSSLHLGPRTGIPTGANEPGTASPGGQVPALPQPGHRPGPDDPKPNRTLLMPPPAPGHDMAPSGPELTHPHARATDAHRSGEAAPARHGQSGSAAPDSADADHSGGLGGVTEPLGRVWRVLHPTPDALLDAPPVVSDVRATSEHSTARTLDRPGEPIGPPVGRLLAPGRGLGLIPPT